MQNYTHNGLDYLPIPGIMDFHFNFQPQQIGMSWQYVIEWHRGPKSYFESTSQEAVVGAASLPAAAGSKNVVVVTSKPRTQTEHELISVESWTNFDHVRATSTNGTKGGHLAIYAKLQRGNSPIQGARVTASLVVQHINGSHLQFEPLELDDNGYGGRSLNTTTNQHQCCAICAIKREMALIEMSELITLPFISFNFIVCQDIVKHAARSSSPFFSSNLFANKNISFQGSQHICIYSVNT